MSVLNVPIDHNAGAAVPSLTSDSDKKGPVIMEIPLDKIRRPLMRTRANDPVKVQELMDSIRVIGLQVPVGIYSFSFHFTPLHPQVKLLVSPDLVR
jgi:hypothetical protein